VREPRNAAASQKVDKAEGLTMRRRYVVKLVTESPAWSGTVWGYGCKHLASAEALFARHEDEVDSSSALVLLDREQGKVLRCKGADSTRAAQYFGFGHDGSISHSTAIERAKPMNLYIVAYSNLQKIGTRTHTNADYKNPNITSFVKNPHSPGGDAGIDDEALYRIGTLRTFHIGTGYERWRDLLASLAGYASVEAAAEFDSGPFWELITFSDRMGAIGPVVSTKLAKDFEDFQPKTDVHPDPEFREAYAKWRSAFEMAKTGAVRFC
jgi:hypothetical protein